jgi:hypothetical protein
MQFNGRHTEPGPDHTSILVHIAGQVGEVRADVKEVKRRVTKLEARKIAVKDYSVPILGALLLAAATAGKITWADALPSLLGLVAR